ncbi:MAG: aspartate carbamoyltransferase [Methylovulum sp.]|nr:aspartate carbamoyltransferase [Methylovulum sp.]
MRKSFIPLLLCYAVSSLANAVEPASNERLDEVAGRGAQVMPFNLEKTLHIFNKTDSGGIQQVVAKHADDNTQITLIRQHLANLAGQFVNGDFSRPKRIHGNDMPGVKELALGAGRVRFTYQDLPDGGQIGYATDAPELIAAIHRYFDAQLSDHARHTMSGGHASHHGGHHP